MDKHIKMLGEIKNKEGFIRFMELYTPTIEDSSIRDYLEAVTSWTEDMDGYYNNAGKKLPQNINWDFIATLFYVGSIYE